VRVTAGVFFFYDAERWRGLVANTTWGRGDEAAAAAGHGGGYGGGNAG
jgi:hypothetical protein